MNTGINHPTSADRRGFVVHPQYLCLGTSQLISLKGTSSFVRGIQTWATILGWLRSMGIATSMNPVVSNLGVGGRVRSGGIRKP